MYCHDDQETCIQPNQEWHMCILHEVENDEFSAVKNWCTDWDTIETVDVWSVYSEASTIRHSSEGCIAMGKHKIKPIKIGRAHV